jgi:hypothetical protein
MTWTASEEDFLGLGHKRPPRIEALPFTLQRIDPVHRITLGDYLELGQRCANRHRKVLSAARCNSHVLSEDWCPLLRRHCHKVNGASASLPDNGFAVRGFDVFHPIRPRAEHRYEVTFTLHGGDHPGIRASTAGCATTDFEDSLELRR